MAKQKVHGPRSLNNLNLQQENLLRAISGNLVNQVGKGVDPYPGQLAPGPSALQSAAFELADQYGTTPEDRQRAEVMNSIFAQPSFRYGPEEYMKYFDQGVADPARRDFARDTLPSIMHAYGSGGQTGTLQAALARGGSDLETNLASQRSMFGLEGLKSEQAVNENWANRAIQGLPISQQLSQAPIQIKSAMGEMQRGIQGEQDAAEFYKWQSAQPYNNPWLSQYLSPALGTATKTFYQPGSSPSFWGVGHGPLGLW